MSKITFYPLGNADCCLIQTDLGQTFIFDFADMRDPEDEEDKRIPLAQSVKDDIGWPEQHEVDVLAVTHGDNDHIKGIADTFWLDHAGKYQGDDRIKVRELWVPAALIVEEGSEDETRIIRAEARHRFLNKSGIRVFARPEHLKEWLENQGKNLKDYESLITNAGRLAPGWTKETNGIEFFVHSPFAERVDDGFLDRNSNCLVMQATIRSDGNDTRFLITADSISENWVRMVNITRAHGNDSRLAWDVLKIPHHCSYLSMSEEKGKEKTTPTDEFEWLLNQGTERSVMVSTSWEIPASDTDQPPHVQTYRRYEDTATALDAELIVTMQNPTKEAPTRTIITVDRNGPTLTKAALTAAFAVTSTKAPRMG